MRVRIKPKGNGSVRVVSLLPITIVYQDCWDDVDSIYGVRDNTLGSLVFRCPKDNGAGWRTTT